MNFELKGLPVVRHFLVSTFSFFFAVCVFASPAEMAVLSGTQTTAISTPNDLNQSTPYAIKWSSSNFDDSYFDHSTSSFSHQVRVKVSGDYRLSFTMPLTLNDASGVRRAILGEVYVNGSPVSTGRMSSSYMRQASGHNESSLHTAILLEGLSVNDTVSIYVNQDTSQTGEVTTEGAQLFLEYIAPSRTIFFGTGVRTTNSTNFNQTTEYAVEWTSQEKDSGFTHSDGSNPQNITLDAIGDYLVFVNIPFESSGCNGRNSPRARVKVAGATVKGGVAAQGYIRCTENHEKSSVHWAGLVTTTAINQTLTITTQSETTNTEAMVVPTGREASVFIEKVDTTNDFITVSGTQVLAGNNWNPNPGSEIRWATQDIIDTSTYSHSTSSNSHKVTVDVAGGYYLLYNDHLTSTSARANPRAKIKVNNSTVSTGVCKTHYIRNGNGHIESSCSLTHFLADLQAGDEISIEMEEEAAGGTVDDASPAIMTIIRVAEADPPSCSGVVECTPDLVLHVDGNTLSSILDENSREADDISFSGDVGTWEDISGSTTTHNLTQTTASERPTFDPVTKRMTFDGVNDHFDVADHADLNLFPALKERSIVVAFTTGSDVTSRQVIYEEGGTVRGMNVYIRGGNLYIGFWNNTNDGDGVQNFTSSSTAVSANTNYYASLVIDYSNYVGAGAPDGELRGHINGVKFTAIGTTTSLLYSHAGDIAVGAMRNDTYFDDGTSSGDGHYFNGDIYELLIYNHAIDDTEAVEFYDYMVARWPDPHPMTDVDLDSQFTSDSSTTPNISWTASVSPDINRYELALGTSPGDTSVSTWTSVGTSTSGNITGLSLSECVDYYASVRAIDDDSNISPSLSTNYIRYDGTAPSDPSGLSISGASSTSVSKVLSWTASTDSCAFSHYEAAIGTSAGASDVVTWTDIGNVASHQFTGITLSGGTDYYTSIRGYDRAGNVSGVVTSVSWQVDTCVASDTTDPSDPGSFVSVGDAGPSASPSHTWTASSDACGFSHYELSIGTSAGGTNVQGWTNVGNKLSHKFFALSPSLSTNTNYFTNIKGVDLAGNESSVVSTSAWQLPSPGGVSSGLALWLDASDSANVFSDGGCSTPVTDGAAVSCWGDKSSSGNDATATGGNRPLWEDNEFNAQAVIRFDGNNDALDFTNINDIRTVFVVNKSDATNFQQFLGHTSTRDFYTPNSVLIGSTISSADLRTGNWRVDRVDVSSPTTFTQTGSYSLISVVADGNVEADHIASDRKSGGRFFDGDIAEVIIYDRALTSTEITNVETYLHNKWFTANPPAVTSLVFDNSYTSSSSQTPTFSWTHSTAPDLSHYEVALGLSAGSNDIAGWTNIGLNDSYQYLGQSLPECTDFFASVRAVDTDSYVSSIESTAFGRFDGTSPTDPSSLLITGSASPSQSKVLNWSASSDACSLSHYEVALGTTSGGTEIETWTDVGNVSSHQFTGQSLSYATDYFMSVRAVDSAGNISGEVSSSAWQLNSCISSDVTPPTVPSGLILSGQASVKSSRNVAWSASTDSCAFSHYEVGIGTSSGAVNVVGYTNVGDVTSYQFTDLVSNLSFGTNYYLTVRAVDQAGNASSGASTSAWTLYQPGGVSVAGLLVWLDADDSETLFQNSACSTSATTNNAPVGCIKDKSGNDSHATNASAPNKPVVKTSSFNSKTSIYFDGSADQFLDFGTETTIRTVFWVLKEDVSSPGNTAPLLGDPGGTTFDFHRGSTLGPIFSAANASASVTGGTLQRNGVSINGTTTNMPSSESVLSLVTTGNTTASAFSRDRTSCCGSRTWGGSLAELIIFDRALSGAEVTDVESYLMTKWSISAGTTEWTGGASTTDWFTAGNWSNGVPTANQNCVIDNKAFDPTISGGPASCKDVDIGDGVLTLANGTGAELQVFGNFQNTGTINQNDGVIEMVDDGNIATTQTIQSTTSLEDLRFDKSAGGSVSVAGGSLTVNDFSISSGNTFDFRVPNGQTLTLPNGMDMASATFDIKGGGTVEMGDSQIISVTGGTFKTSGTNDAIPQNLTNKGLITRESTGRWGFSATAGTVRLTGFLIDYIDSSGLNISGTANLAALDGGQFTNLNQDYITPVTAIQIDSTTTPGESLASNVGFNWGSANGVHSGIPDPSDNYVLVNAPNCNGAAIVFDLWDGDFFVSSNNPVTEDKIIDADDGGNTCQISMAASASPVTLVDFKAYPYDESAVLLWETGAEVNHFGFNVLRSDSMYTGYSQINPVIILNFNNSTMFKGDYYFLDENLTNGQTYYYMIEDVGLDGSVKRHGPVSVTPQASQGTAPPPQPEENAPPPPPTPGNDLGNGVEIVAQTQNSIRLEVVPGALDIQDSAWSVSHKDLYIPGYSKTLEAGYPELLARKILIEVSKNYTSVNVVEHHNNSSDVSASLMGEKVTPAPEWVNVGGTLQAQYSENADAYAEVNYSPDVFYEVRNEAISINGKYYLEITVWPLNYAAASNSLLRLDYLLIDIGIDGDAWESQPPSGSFAVAPASVEGGIRIKYSKAGMYELLYSDLSSANLEGSLKGVNVDLLRLYYHGVEMPIEVIDGDGVFSAGDSVRFYAPYEENLEDVLDEVVLTQFDLGSGSDFGLSPRRYAATNNPPAEYPVAAWTQRTVSKVAEQNLVPIFDRPIGGIVDRFYWKRIWVQGGSTPNSDSQLDFSVDLSNIITNSSVPVKVRIHVRAIGTFAQNPEFHLGIYLDGEGSLSASQVFTGSHPQVLEFEFDSSRFVNGINNIRLEAQGDYIPAGDYESHDINKVEFIYQSHVVAENGQLDLFGLAQQQQVVASGFTSQTLNIYDHTDKNEAMKYQNYVMEDMGGGNWMALFDSYEGEHWLGGKNITIVQDGTFLVPDSIDFAYGNTFYLRDPATRGAYLVIGHESLLDAIYPLIQHRQNQGLSVVAVSYDEIEAEFSHGRRSSFGIREFLSLAANTWSEKPKYILFLGDASFDPNDLLGQGNGRMVPTPIEEGEHLDFGSDNFFVSSDLDHLPKTAIGRLPSNDPEEISAYVRKVLDYEAGARSPEGLKAKSALFISGEDDANEGFAEEVNRLAQNLSSVEKNFSTMKVHRKDHGSDASAKSAITDEFDSGRMLVTFLGHGAEDLWGSNDMFNGADARALTNTELPIVLAMNCLNNYYYNNDLNDRSLGEEMVFNEDGGAIAFWGSTSLTSPTAQINLANSFYSELASKTTKVPKTVRLGDLMLNAKVKQGPAKFSKDAVRSYTLFGDPALKIPRDSFSGKKSSSSSSSSGGGGCTANADLAGDKGNSWTVFFHEMGFFLAVFIVWLAYRARKARWTP